MSFSNLKLRSFLIAGAVMAVSHSSLAQVNTISDLSSIGGNATQDSVGKFIDSWLTDNTAFATAGGQEQELYDICTQYANDINGTALTNAEKLELVDYVSNEEIAALGSGLTDTGHDQAVSMLGRLQALRAGTPGLASINEFGLGGAAGADFSKLSYFANVSYGDGEKDRTKNEQGFDFDSQALTFGADYRFADDLIAGVAIGWGQSDIDIDGGFGDTENDSLSLTLYGTYFIDDWYVDWTLGYAEYDYDSKRYLPVSTLMMMGPDQVLSSSTDGDALNWSIGGGITQMLKGWNADYSLHLNAVDAKVDGYSESGGSLALNVGDQDIESLQAVLSAQFSKAFSKDWGVIQPYGGIEIHQEFEDDTRVVTAAYKFDSASNQFSFTSDDADSTYFLLSVGSSFILSQGKQLFVNLDHIVGLDDVDSNTLTAGIRFEL